MTNISGSISGLRVASAQRARGAEARARGLSPSGNHHPRSKRVQTLTPLESSAEGFLATDAAGLVTYVHGCVERVFGKRRDDLVGRHVRELLPAELATPFLRAAERVLANGIPATFEVFQPHPGMWLDARLYPADGGVVAYLSDSSEHRVMEEQLAHALAREQAEHEAEVASREATQRMELFMAMASHEFRTPLTVIKGYLHLAEQYLGIRLPEVQIAAPLAQALQATRQSVALAQQASERLTGLLDDLLLVSSARAGKLRMRPQPCDLISIVRDTVDELRRMYPSRQIRLRLPANRRAPIIAHPERIAQVVTNYLANAFKYAPQDHPVGVRMSVRERTARVSVRDSGPGLPAADQSAIWNGFYQAPGIQRQVDSDAGLGLGLYVCRTIIEQHEGQVGIHSAVGRGSTFWFTLPLSPAGA